ncbi:hypothetical protein [Absidia glauca]|uniref:Extracellular membrane protein CFEM domain-containing protein n=1 Tax=Absidia glauca TaxID=4829 RepID=A0A163KJD9_ABSGL|nr:hypothetical protein [Absidia glauca]
MKTFFILAAALISPMMVSAGCQCEASNNECTTTCGQGMMACLYGCEADETDACVNGCLDTYWPIIGTQEELNAKLPFVKRSAEDPLVASPASHHNGGQEFEGGEGFKEKESHGDTHGSGSHGKKDSPEKGRTPSFVAFVAHSLPLVEKGPEEKHLPVPPVIEVPREENRRPDENIHDDFKRGGKEGFGHNGAGVLHPLTSFSVVGLALTGAFLITF